MTHKTAAAKARITLTVNEAAERNGTNRHTILLWINDNKVKYIRPANGDPILIYEDSLPPRPSNLVLQRRKLQLEPPPSPPVPDTVVPPRPIVDLRTAVAITGLSKRMLLHRMRKGIIKQADSGSRIIKVFVDTLPPIRREYRPRPKNQIRRPSLPPAPELVEPSQRRRVNLQAAIDLTGLTKEGVLNQLREGKIEQAPGLTKNIMIYADTLMKRGDANAD